METFNLKTTLTAYPKLSSSILKDYVTKEELDTTLQNYVEEAPVDSNPYARKDEQWVELNKLTLLNDISLAYGVSNLVELQKLSDTESFDKVVLDKHTSSYNLTYNQQSSGYFWIVCNRKISNILWMGMVADYIEQPTKLLDSNDFPVYCYRIVDALIPQQLNFTINL